MPRSCPTPKCICTPRPDAHFFLSCSLCLRVAFSTSSSGFAFAESSPDPGPIAPSEIPAAGGATSLASTDLWPSTGEDVFSAVVLNDGERAGVPVQRRTLHVSNVAQQKSFTVTKTRDGLLHDLQTSRQLHEPDSEIRDTVGLALLDPALFYF